jgi:hypothetical protein
MTNKMVAGFLALILAGCSREPAKNADASNTAKPPTAAAVQIEIKDVTLVESAESKDRKEIRARAKELFAAKSYDDLEKFAHQYRSSRDIYPDGMSKLREVYTGISPGEGATEADWKSHLDRLHTWIGTKTNSITARMALADALISYAWKARGSGYANTVTQDGWKLMGKRLAESVQAVKDAATLPEQCPRRWSSLMSAALGLGVEKPQYEALYKKAVGSETNFAAGYCSSMAYYLLPRWHGAPGEMEAFVEKTADKIGGDDGDVFYARVAWYMQSVLDNAFTDSKLSWERADKGYQILEKRFPDSIMVKNQRAFLALMGSTTPQFPRILIAGLKGKIDAETWTSKEKYIRLVAFLK